MGRLAAKCFETFSSHTRIMFIQIYEIILGNSANFFYSTKMLKLTLFSYLSVFFSILFSTLSSYYKMLFKWEDNFEEEGNQMLKIYYRFMNMFVKIFSCVNH